MHCGLKWGSLLVDSGWCCCKYTLAINVAVLSWPIISGHYLGILLDVGVSHVTTTFHVEPGKMSENPCQSWKHWRIKSGSFTAIASVAYCLMSSYQSHMRVATYGISLEHCEPTDSSTKRNWKRLTLKLEELISLYWSDLSLWFQRLYPGFWVARLSGASANVIRCRRQH